jgi:hypothetical protein
MRDLTRWVAHGKIRGVAKVLESGDFVGVATLGLKIGDQQISHLPKIILSQIAENIQLGNGQARRVAGLADEDMKPLCGLLSIKKSEDYFRLFPNQRVVGWPSLAQARELLKPATATPSATTTATATPSATTTATATPSATTTATATPSATAKAAKKAAKAKKTAKK